MSEIVTRMPSGAEITYAARRRARFVHLLNRARKAVEGEPRLTEDERAEIARIWLSGPGGEAPS